MFLPLNTFENICVCFLLLMIYSTIGWVAEMIYHSIVIGHMSESAGFLNGFLCPIYGHGALLVLYVLHGGLKNPILTFLAGMVLTSALEYFTSWIMEALFHMRWWDYSNCKYQLNGRVCLTNTFFFGLGCGAFVPCRQPADHGVAVPRRPGVYDPGRVVHLRPVPDGHHPLRAQRHPAVEPPRQAPPAASGGQGSPVSGRRSAAAAV